MKNKRIWRAVVLVGMLFSLFACSGGGDGDGPIGTGEKPINHVVSGTAATGAPIANSTVRIKGKGGVKNSGLSDDNGKFTIGLNDVPGSILLRVERAGLPHLYSIVTSNDEAVKIANIHPYTDVIVRNWFAVQGLNIDQEFDSDGAISILPSVSDIAQIQEAIKGLIALALIQFQIPDGFNLITTEFNADQTGFDSFLDNSQVTINNSILNIEIFDFVFNIYTTIVSIGLNQDLTVVDEEIPSTPQNVRAIPASDTEIVLLWDISTDNVGIAGYEIVRDGNVIATTAHPVYSDTGLTLSTEYCYFVDALDGAGNRSARAATVTCGTTLQAPDTTPPSSIADLLATSTTESTISLTWTPPLESDVVGYHIHRKSGDTFVQIGSSLTSDYTDTNLDASTTYCYSIQAYDAARNVGDSSPEFCATTTDIVPQEDVRAPDVAPSQPAGDYVSQITVTLTCDDNGGSGCAGIYYTLDSSEPSESSTLYTSGIVLNATTTLKFIAVDNAGNSSEIVVVDYNINIPPSQVLTVITNDSTGTVSSDIVGIDCGAVCESSFATDSQVTLTASHSSGLVAIWTGCASTVINECTLDMNQDRAVYVSFVAELNESASNDTYDVSQQISNASIVYGYFNAVDDADYYRIDVTDRGTFMANISHGSATSFLTLYNFSNQVIASSGGCCGAAVHGIAYSLDPGTYYLRVLSDSVEDLVNPYTLALSGTVLGTVSPDIYEENDSFTTAIPVTGTGPITMQGYLDTINDADYFSFEVTTRSTFLVTIAHATSPSFMTLYNSQFAAVTNSGGCCGAATHTMTQSLDPGTYYVRVLSDNVSNLNTPYTLTFTGTAFNVPSPDVNEENDSFATATLIGGDGPIMLQGYLDTMNDADFYRFEVTARSTFLVTIAHQTSPSFMTLYNSQFAAITNSGGCCGAATHTMTQSLDPGTYYVRVLSDSVSNLSAPYTLTFTGTAFNVASPDQNEENDSFTSATQVAGTGPITLQGYLDTMNDADYYRFEVTTRSTFLVTIAHQTSPSFMTLYNSQFAAITNSGGCCGAATHTMTQSLDPGTYYVRVLSDSVSNLSSPYILTFTGTAFNVPSPDLNEENDSFVTATSVTSNGVLQGYLDTMNDADYFSFEVTARSTFMVTIAHTTSPSFMTLYDSQFAVVTSSGGCCGAATHTMTQSLDPGTYYVRVLSDSVSNLSAPYMLTFEGTALGGASPDAHEENDSFATATLITDNATYQGYFDTINDADFYVINVSVPGLLEVNVAHASKTSFVTLYDDQQTAIVTSGGCCGATNHSISEAVDAGTYYIRILSDSVFDLSSAYTLSLPAIQ